MLFTQRSRISIFEDKFESPLAPLIAMLAVAAFRFALVTLKQLDLAEAVLGTTITQHSWSKQTNAWGPLC